MVSDLIPTSVWSFPSIRFTSLSDDASWSQQNGVPTGLSINEDEAYVYVEAALPGVKSDDIDMSFHHGVLRITGEVREERSSRKHHKRMTSSYSYQVVVPGEIDLNADPEAWCVDGVVSVAFPKLSAVQPKKIRFKSKVTNEATATGEATVSETAVPVEISSVDELVESEAVEVVKEEMGGENEHAEGDSDHEASAAEVNEKGPAKGRMRFGQKNSPEDSVEELVLGKDVAANEEKDSDEEAVVEIEEEEKK